MCITEVLLQIWESDCIFVWLLKCLYKCGKALAAIPLKAWKAERDKLNGEKKQLTRQYYALKDEVKEVEQIRRNYTVS